MNMPVTFASWKTLHFAWGGPLLQAAFKQQPEDFRVAEELGFEPDGAGEHLFLHIEKTGLSTFEAQGMLARHFRIPAKDIAYAGMKDKQGVTRQWFSVHARKESTGDTDLQHPHLRILRATRNSRKLRRGTHKGNRFRIVLRNPVGDRDACVARLQTLATGGVPNYFGGQRFGRREDNTDRALAWFSGELNPGRQERSLILSAARSYLFNAVLSERVRSNTWNSALEGDVIALAGTGSTFAAERATADELQNRLQALDIHATGPLWGRGQLASSGAAQELELRIIGAYQQLRAGLETHGLVQERRPLRLVVTELQSSFSADALTIEFSLGRGAYATSVLRELVTTEEQ